MEEGGAGGGGRGGRERAGGALLTRVSGTLTRIATAYVTGGIKKKCQWYRVWLSDSLIAERENGLNYPDL